MTAYEFGRVKFLLTDINISTGILLKEANSAFNFFFFFFMNWVPRIFLWSLWLNCVIMSLE